jgi:ribosomal protein L1
MNDDERKKLETDKEELLESIMEDIKELQDLYKRIKKFKFEDCIDIVYLQGNIDPIDNIIDGAKEYLEFLEELEEKRG